MGDAVMLIVLLLLVLAGVLVGYRQAITDKLVKGMQIIKHAWPSGHRKEDDDNDGSGD